MTDRPIHNRWLLALLFLGLFLTIRGYRSREGDQAYRLPLLLHQHNPAVYANDPFVRSFDTFNPHRGYLWLIEILSAPLGLSGALFVLFALTFVLTFRSLDRLARAVWSDVGPGVGIIAAGLVLIAQAGNIGTNHLFEPILLDRLIAFGLGWLAIGLVVDQGSRWTPWVVGVACLVHPTVGVQLGMLLGVFWVVELWFDRDWIKFGKTIGSMGLALIPGVWLNLGQSGQLLDGLPTVDFRLLSVELQGPQHMLPHLWRMPQWLAWGCYPVLAGLALVSSETRLTEARRRLLILLGINLVGLLLAWYGIERLHHLRLTLFQPFRMATIARGLCLVLVSGHWLRLWRSGTLEGRVRAGLLGVGLIGDWSLVVVTAFEGVLVVMGCVRRSPCSSLGLWAPACLPPHKGGENSCTELLKGWMSARNNPRQTLVAFAILAYGLVFLARHDTEYGHLPLLAALVIPPIIGLILKRQTWEWSPSRVVRLTAYAWIVPLLALGANLVSEGSKLAKTSVRRHLVRLCRFGEVPLDDVERLGLWCREHVPLDARIVGPPGPKTLRLWSERNVAFNRAASPYNARGLADWSRRFADHVGFTGPPGAFVRAYANDRHGLEAHYDALSPEDRASLADRQESAYVIGPANRSGIGCEGLERVHTEGHYTLYRRTRTNPPLLTRATR